MRQNHPQNRSLALVLLVIASVGIVATALFTVSRSGRGTPAANRAETESSRPLPDATSSASAAAESAAATPLALTRPSYAEAQPLIAAAGDTIPAALRGKSPAAMETEWPAWLSRHDQEIRARLD